VALGGSGWLWVALAGSSWLWVPLASSGWLWLALAGSGWLWLALAGSGCSGWLWVALAGSGSPWLWLVLAGSGWLWLALAGSGWLWMITSMGGSQDISKTDIGLLDSGSLLSTQCGWPCVAGVCVRVARGGLAFTVSQFRLSLGCRPRTCASALRLLVATILQFRV
jgi:hypothetical protein